MKFPRKHGVMMNFLSSMLRDEVINIAFFTIMTIGGDILILLCIPIVWALSLIVFAYS